MNVTSYKIGDYYKYWTPGLFIEKNTPKILQIRNKLVIQNHVVLSPSYNTLGNRNSHMLKFSQRKTQTKGFQPRFNNSTSLEERKQLNPINKRNITQLVTLFPARSLLIKRCHASWWYPLSLLYTPRLFVAR